MRKSVLTGMKAQQAALETLVPSGQTAVSAAGAALTTAARPANARREVKAIGMSIAKRGKSESKLVVLRRAASGEDPMS